MIDSALAHGLDLLGMFAMFCAVCATLLLAHPPTSLVRFPRLVGWLRPSEWRRMRRELQAIDKTAAAREWTVELAWFACLLLVALAFLTLLKVKLLHPYPLPNWTAVWVKFPLAGFILMGKPRRPA